MTPTGIACPCYRITIVGGLGRSAVRRSVISVSNPMASTPCWLPRWTRVRGPLPPFAPVDGGVRGPLPPNAGGLYGALDRIMALGIELIELRRLPDGMN